MLLVLNETELSHSVCISICNLYKVMVCAAVWYDGCVCYILRCMVFCLILNLLRVLDMFDAKCLNQIIALRCSKCYVFFLFLSYLQHINIHTIEIAVYDFVCKINGLKANAFEMQLFVSNFREWFKLL